MGDVISDLNRRRGKVQSIDPDKNNVQQIKVMFHYLKCLGMQQL